MSAADIPSTTIRTDGGNRGHHSVVKRKVTKKRRNIDSESPPPSFSLICDPRQPESGPVVEMDLNVTHVEQRNNVDDDDHSTKYANGNPSTSSNKSDSDIMIIEQIAPDKHRASTNGSADPPSMTPSSETTAPTPLLSQKSSDLMSQLSSSQSIHLEPSPVSTNKTFPDLGRSSPLTPPPTRGQLEKQIQDALQKHSAVPSYKTSGNESVKVPPSSELHQSPQATDDTLSHSTSPLSQRKTPKKVYYDTRASPITLQFSWDKYLEIYPAEPAPQEAFCQPKIYPKNMFIPGMKLQAKDPRSNMKALATVVFVEGLHLRLRFLGTDTMNDLYELVDSENIEPLTDTIDQLYAPAGYKFNIGQYQKFVEKTMREDMDNIAPKSFFPAKPQKPPRNLFQEGMKLEAVDRKNRDFIYPATVGEVTGDTIKVMFDGWRGSFDYTCKYYSRDIFPINWCRDVGRPIQPPNGWIAMLQKGPAPKDSPSSIRPPPTPKNTGKTTKPTQKKRGRPLKSSKAPYSSTPKKKDVPISSIPRSRPASVVSEDHSYSANSDDRVANNIDAAKMEQLVEDDDAELDLENPHQCQRTTPVHEWRWKKKESQMPQVDKPSSDMKQNGSQSSDTFTTASTVALSRDSSDFNGDVSKVKKPRTADSSASSNTSTSNGKLQELVLVKPRKLSEWRVDDVIDIIKTEDTLGKYVQVFQDNEIDGKAFGLFGNGKEKTEMLMQIGLKMGPVLKILDLRERVIPYLDMAGT